MKINFGSLDYLFKAMGMNGVNSVKNGSEPESQGFIAPNLRTDVSNSALPNAVYFNNLTKLQQAILIKELLNLPKEWMELLSVLVYKEISQESLLNIMKDQNLKIRIEDVKTLLDVNSKDVINKLLKLIQPAPGNIQNIDQMKELLGLISQIVPSSNSPAQEVLKNVILLYLPWLPLAQEQNIHIVFEKKGSSEESEQDNVALIIYITTVNLGKFKVIILLNNDKSLKIEIENQDISNNDEDDISILENIRNNVNQELLNNKIACDTKVYTCKNTVNQNSERREVSLYPISSISPRIMMAAYSVIRIIFEFDEKSSLVKNREKMIAEETEK